MVEQKAKPTDGRSITMPKSADMASIFPPRGFVLARAIRLGELVAEAYRQYDCFREGADWNAPAGYELVRRLSYSWRPLGSIDKNGKLDDYLRRLGTFGKAKSAEIPIGFVARRRNEAFLVFRGTQTASEWVNNFNAKFVDFFLDGAGSVHEGFQNAYLQFRSQIAVALEGLDAARIHVAGHSLGAAFATFAAYDLERVLHRKAASLHTFGSPRIGDDAFVRGFNASFGRKTFRIANTADLVTEIPFPVPFAGVFGGYFSHADAPVVLTVQKNDIEQNHSIATYVAALRAGDRRRGWIAKLFGGFTPRT